MEMGSVGAAASILDLGCSDKSLIFVVGDNIHFDMAYT